VHLIDLKTEDNKHKPKTWLTLKLAVGLAKETPLLEESTEWVVVSGLELKVCMDLAKEAIKP
jgi:hypothetical protein